MSQDKELFIKAIELWSSFKEELLYKNRYIVNHELLEYLKHFSGKNLKIIDKDKTLYRARLFTGDKSFIPYLNSGLSDKGLDFSGNPLVPMPPSFHPIKSRQQSGFWGYNEEESFVPKNNQFVNDGRANPVFIKYLYTSEEPYTALVEVRPYIESTVSIAEIRVKESLTLGNYSAL